MAGMKPTVLDVKFEPNSKLDILLPFGIIFSFYFFFFFFNSKQISDVVVSSQEGDAPRNTNSGNIRHGM